MRAQLARDFARFGRELPRDWPAHVRDRYRIDLATEYLGVPVAHPIGKASGQLSLKLEQLEADAEAGLAFAVLKTVIAEDETGARTMGAWAIHESRMRVERRVAADGREGWTVTWKGRGWDRSFAEYLDLVRAGRELTRASGMLVVPSVKYHLPRLGEPFRAAEYRHTTSALAAAWGEGPLLLEKDFSPTLAGDPLADEQAQILRWLREVPAQVRSGAPGPVRLALKLMNARFDDAFQRRMLEAAQDADWLVVFNRLWDAERGVAYGGWDLSERNLRVLTQPPVPLPRRGRGDGQRSSDCQVNDSDQRGRPPPPPGEGTGEGSRQEGGHDVGRTATGNIVSGRLLLDYARAGCASAQLHTFFQLPLGAYPAESGSRTQRALHALVFHPEDGLIAGLLALEERGALGRVGGELRFRDLIGLDLTARSPSPS